MDLDCVCRSRFPVVLRAKAVGIRQVLSPCVGRKPVPHSLHIQVYDSWRFLHRQHSDHKQFAGFRELIMALFRDFEPCRPRHSQPIEMSLKALDQSSESLLIHVRIFIRMKQVIIIDGP